MEYEVMEALAKEEAKKHKVHKKHETRFDKSLGQEVTTITEEKPVKKVVVLMPKQAAFPDPSAKDMDSIRKYAAKNKQTVFEIEHEEEAPEAVDAEESSKKKKK